jgi:hypothetical protein
MVRAQAPQPEAEEPAIVHRIMEAYPDHLQASIELRNRTLAAALDSGGHAGAESVIFLSSKWPQNKVIRVAFLDGDKDLHHKVAQAAAAWDEFCNLELDFGRDATTGEYRRWTTNDTTYKADIRISFDRNGYWSLVGVDSANPLLGGPGQPEGGRPNQRSMNFDGFKAALPDDYAATVLHEFGHALGCQHMHQHPTEGCETDFRWADDPHYVPTRDQFGQFKPDSQGRRPGIYTVLGGPPNNWTKATVDFNLRQLDASTPFEGGSFDAKSIMKYYFPDWMFVGGSQSRCFTLTPNDTLSDEDKLGLWMAYPTDDDPPAPSGPESPVALALPVGDGADRAAALESQRRKAVALLQEVDPAAQGDLKAHYESLK